METNHSGDSAIQESAVKDETPVDVEQFRVHDIKAFAKAVAHGETVRIFDTTLQEAVPMLPGSSTLNDLAHNDGGRTARTVLVKNGFSTAANADFYRRNLESEGWKVTNHYRLQQPENKGDVLVLRQGVRELSITATRDPQDARQSNVLLNYVDQP